MKLFKKANPKKIINNEIFKSLNDPSFNLSIKATFINIKDESSYDDFKTCLGEFSIITKSSMKDFKYKVDKISLFKMSFLYCYIRREKLERKIK